MKENQPSTRNISDQTARAIVRQLRILNRWLAVFGVLVLGTLAIVLFLLFQVVTAIHDVSQRMQQAGGSIDVRYRACQAEGAFGDFLRSRSDVCK